MSPSGKTQGPLRRLLPYVAVVWGVLLILGLVIGWAEYSSNSSSSRHGSAGLSLIFATALIVLGSKEIRSHHLERSRALPWLMGFAAVCIALAIVVVVAERGQYPAAVRANFISGCETRGGSAAGCGCALSWFEAHKSLSEFYALDAEVRAGGAVPADVTAGLASCRQSQT